MRASVRAGEGRISQESASSWAEQRMKELCLAQSGLEIRAGSSGDEHRKIPHLAEKEMVGTRRLELLTSTVITRDNASIRKKAVSRTE